MKTSLTKVWEEVLQPLIHRPSPIQLAALCYREKKSKKEVLLITSRGTGRWILPKGWPIDGLDTQASVLQEAWEEAGVAEGEIAAAPIGSFSYLKRFDTGLEVSCRIDVFPVKVLKLATDYPEKAERQRKWVPPGTAAELVDEPRLREILAGF